MRILEPIRPRRATTPRPLRVGFMPETDCAPLVAASQLGCFEKYGLEVELQREPEWSVISAKILAGELDAAHAPAALPFLTNLAFGSAEPACVSGLVLSSQSEAICLSRKLLERGVHDAHALRRLIHRRRRRPQFTFGVALPYTTSFFLLRQWLASAGISSRNEVRIVVLPAPAMLAACELALLDGFCLAEPWTTMAVQAGLAVTVATAAKLSPLQPEKVLMVCRQFAEARADEHERLIAALIEAGEFCDQPENRSLLANLLAQRHFVDASMHCVRASLGATAHLPDQPVQALHQRLVFHRHRAAAPTEEKSVWLLAQLQAVFNHTELKDAALRRVHMLKSVFRPDIFKHATALTRQRAQDFSCNGNTRVSTTTIQPPQGFGLRQPSGAFRRHRAIKSARGLAHSKTLSRSTPIHDHESRPHLNGEISHEELRETLAGVF